MNNHQVLQQDHQKGPKQNNQPQKEDQQGTTNSKGLKTTKNKRKTLKTLNLVQPSDG
jgi:hypothetical protein